MQKEFSLLFHYFYDIITIMERWHSKEEHRTGIYFNPNHTDFYNAVNHSQIYIDKTELIQYTNSVLFGEQKYICVSRPRRFGKSVAANMLTAYYSRDCDSKELFQGLKIATHPDFEKHLNQYNVIHLNMQSFLSKTQTVEQMIALVTKAVGRDLLRAYPDIDYLDKFIWLCEKISVNSTTVIKNDIASGLKNSRSIFLQYTINTVICQIS